MKYRCFIYTFKLLCYPQVMSGCPLPGGGRGDQVLKLLKALSPILQPSLVEMWDTVIPKLIQYLEGVKCCIAVLNTPPSSGPLPPFYPCAPSPSHS